MESPRTKFFSPDNLSEAVTENVNHRWNVSAKLYGLAAIVDPQRGRIVSRLKDIKIVNSKIVNLKDMVHCNHKKTPVFLQPRCKKLNKAICVARPRSEGTGELR